MRVINKISKEELSHFLCGSCRKWWTIGDVPKGRVKWHCPWCGKLQRFFKKPKNH